MRRRSMGLLCGLLALSSLALAAEPGQLQLPDLSALAKRASQSVVISLDPSMLSVAAGFLQDDSNADSAAIKSVVQGLRGVYVRSFIFDHDGAYSQQDVEVVRAQLTAPWQPLVSTRDNAHRRNVDIYVRRNGQLTEGMAIIAAEPRKLTIVNIVGSIDLAKLAKLQGQFGVPKISVSGP